VAAVIAAVGVWLLVLALACWMCHRAREHERCPKCREFETFVTSEYPIETRYCDRCGEFF
jgi:hypothetical protein